MSTVDLETADASDQAVFGLGSESKIELIQEMLRDGFIWNEIGEAIGWPADAVERYYEREHGTL